MKDSHSERKQRSGFVVFKENGVFIVLPLFLATMLVFIALRDNPFGIQIAVIIFYTGFVFLLVFCDAGGGIAARRGTKGYSLGEKAVRQKLPLLACIHTGILVVIFAVVTAAIRIGPHTWFLWHLDDQYFYMILVFAGTAIEFVQIHIFRGILGRALKEAQRSNHS